MSKIKITSLYERYKNTNKKLKIVCDWDEVIQACEPYALCNEGFSSKFFEVFWKETRVKYSPYGSHLEFGNSFSAKKVLENQKEIKNSPNFYQQAPFLTIAEDLLRLIREDKVEKLIFLSTYDKKKFPNGDFRKIEIINETFLWNPFPINVDIKYELIPFESENQGQSKAGWIKDNASDFDIVIDDNPNICKSIVENYLPRRNCGKCKKILTIELAGGYKMADDGVNISYVICRDKNCQKECENFWKVAELRSSYNNEDEYWNSETDYTHYPTIIRKKNKPPITVIAPYYPAVENQHHSEVVLVKNEVSNLKKEDFNQP